MRSPIKTAERASGDSEIGILRPSVARVPHLDSFLGGRTVRVRPWHRPARFAAIAGWGHKPTAAPARRYAARHGLPYWSIEDGFLRSVGLGFEGDPPISLVVDRTGIYYDARTPSALENLLEQGGWESADLLARARAGIAMVRRHRLSKYNAAPQRTAAELGLLDGKPSRPRVLVLDQTRGDASITGGLASDGSFAGMIEAAADENPGADIYLKLHPDVLAGKVRGYVDRDAAPRGARILDCRVNPWSLIDRVDRVYTVTSQLGFEAAMAGLPVTCFGMPFYAGWGATDDRVSCPRRTRRRSAAEIFAAAYLLYARYVDPSSGRPCSFEDGVAILARLALQYCADRSAAVEAGRAESWLADAAAGSRR
jgi:capsular polysaccharide export protein